MAYKPNQPKRTGSLLFFLKKKVLQTLTVVVHLLFFLSPPDLSTIVVQFTSSN